MTPSTSGRCSASARTAFARISSLTGRDSHPLARRSPRVAGRLMGRAYAEGLVSRQSRTSRAANEAMDLSGQWRAHASEPDLAKTFADPDSDDTSWERVTVPHQWRSELAFADHDGPVLYRRQFQHEPGPADRRWFLEVDGIFYYGDVWFDGEYLGATEGYFVRHAFEVTQPLRERDQHVLAIEVACPPQRDRSTKRTITGGYWHSPVFDRSLNPGGIWRPVRLASSGPVRLCNARALCVDASIERSR